MATCKEWIKKSSLEKYGNGVQLEEEKEDLEILGCRTTGMRENGITTMEWGDREEWGRKIKLKL